MNNCHNKGVCGWCMSLCDTFIFRDGHICSECNNFFCHNHSRYDIKYTNGRTRCIICSPLTYSNQKESHNDLDHYIEYAQYLQKKYNINISLTNIVDFYIKLYLGDSDNIYCNNCFFKVTPKNIYDAYVESIPAFNILIDKEISEHFIQRKL